MDVPHAQLVSSQSNQSNETVTVKVSKSNNQMMRVTGLWLVMFLTPFSFIFD